MTYASISKQCYSYLLDQITSGKLRQGAIINRRQIAKELGASRSPVTDAVNQLVAEGILEIQSQVGTRVRIINANDLRGLFMIRLALECQAARFYCGETIVHKRSQLQILADSADKFSYRSYERALAEVEFHSALIELTNSKIYNEEFQKVMLKNNIYQASMIIQSLNILNPLKTDSHSILLDRLEESDPSIAEEAIRDHLYFPIQTLLNSSNHY